MANIYTPAVYMLTHEPTGLFYIGSSSSFGLRVNSHKHQLLKGIHKATRLQEVFKSWDEIDVRFTEVDSPETALATEQHFLNLFYGHPLCVNSASSVRSDQNLSYNSGGVKCNEKQNAANAANAAKCRKRVSIAGIEYPSIKDARLALNLPKKTVIGRLKNANFVDWKYLSG